jgi:DNA-binding MarR family transcriptional regulator
LSINSPIELRKPIITMSGESLEQLLAAPARARSQYAKSGFEGLTPRAIQALIAVQMLGDPSVKDVADRIAVSQRAGGDLLRKLRGMELIESNVDFRDSRLQRQHIAPKGGKLVRRFKRELERAAEATAPRRKAAPGTPVADPSPPDLASRFRALESLKPHSKGYEAERLVAGVLRRAHFRVDRNPGIARPSQTDVLASDGKTDYLIEVKATTKPVDVAAVKAVWARLDAAPSGAVGVIVSLSGFAGTVATEIAAHRSRPVLLVTAAELEQLVGRPWMARGLFQRKLDRLRRDGVVAGPEELASLGVAGPDESSSEEVWLVDDSGERISWVESGGEFGMFSFTGSYEPTDMDLEPGSGKRLEVMIASHSQTEILAVFDELDQLGWLTEEGRWCIQQSETTWHGVGLADLTVALRNWKQRYEGIDDLHYREEVLYVDTCHLGTYSIGFDVAARHDREVWYARMSIHLPGVPADVQPYLELVRSISSDPPGFFRRTRTDPGQWSPTGRNLRKLTPIARVASTSVLKDERGPYVRGVILANPFAGSSRITLPDGAPPQLSNSELLVCELGSWHQLSDGPATYQITDVEWAWLGEGFSIRVRADWDDAAFERKLQRRFAGGPQRSGVTLDLT